MADVSTFEVELLARNDNRVVARLSLGPDGTALDGATVVMRLLTEEGDDVVLPQIMVEEDDVTITLGGQSMTARLYSTVIDKTAPLILGHAYKVVVTATHPGGYDAEWSKREVARERTG
jgi:hypothetical protein